MTELEALKHNVTAFRTESLKILEGQQPSEAMKGYAEKVQALSEENPEAVQTFREAYPHLVRAYDAAMAFPNYEYPVIIPTPED